MTPDPLDAIRFGGLVRLALLAIPAGALAVALWSVALALVGFVALLVLALAGAGVGAAL